MTEDATNGCEMLFRKLEKNYQFKTYQLINDRICNFCPTKKH